MTVPLLFKTLKFKTLKKLYSRIDKDLLVGFYFVHNSQAVTRVLLSVNSAAFVEEGMYI